MGWPLSQDYNEAIQNPATSFAAADLKRGEVVPGPLGLPMPRSGNFADVYQMIDANGQKWAIKCFTRQVPGLQDRYTKIDTHLQRAQLPFTVGFQFLDQGIRIRGEWYPILKMEWVEGVTLNEFVRNFADKPPYLRALLGLWLKLSSRLREARIAHADLQHGNVLLVPGASANKLNLKLIDYDGMWVPALAKVPSGEAGHPAYQHPFRLRDRIYSADVDRFPHLVIACALRATALGGKQLWQTFDNGDNLLFREADFANPAQSKLLRTLWNMDDPTITNLLALMVLSSQRPLADTPWIDEVLVGETTTAVSDGLLAQAADVLGVPRRGVRQALPTAQVYVTPEQGNVIARAYEEMATAPLPRHMRRRRSAVPFALGLGGAMLLLVGIGVGIALSGKRDAKTDPPPVAKKDDTDTTPKLVDRPAKLDANWQKLEPSPAVAGVQTIPDLPDAGNNRVLRVVQNLAAGLAISYHAESKKVVLAGRDVLAVSDLLGAAEPQYFGGTDGPFSHAAISANAAFLTTVSQERVVICWDVATRQQLWTINFPDRVTALAITPDAKRVAITGVGVGYLEYDIAKNKEVRRHPQIQAEEMHFTAEGEYLLTRIGEVLEYWGLDAPERKATFTPGFTPKACGIGTNGVKGLEVWAGGKANEIKRWSLITNSPQPDVVPGRMDDIRGITPLARAPGFLVRDTRAVGLGFDVNKPQAPELVTLPIGGINSVFTTRDGQTALLGNEKGFAVVRVSEANKPPPKKSVEPVHLVWSLKTEPNPSQVLFESRGLFALAASATRVYVADTTNGKQVGVFQANGPIHAVGFASEEQLAVCHGPADKPETTLWKWSDQARTTLSMTEPEILTNLQGVPHPTKAKHVLARSAKRGVLLFDTETGKPVPKWPNTATPITQAALHPDGVFILCGAVQGPLKYWSVESQESFRTLEGSDGALRVHVTPDGKKFVGLFPLGRLMVWEVETGKIDTNVGHDVPGPFRDLQLVSGTLALLTTGTEGMTTNVLVDLETGKTLDLKQAPAAFRAQQALLPAKEQMLRVQGEELQLWTYSNKQLAALPEVPKPAPPMGANPDLLLVRDAPTAPLVGFEYSQGGGQLFAATSTGRMQRYNAETFALEREGTANDAELRHMQRSGQRLFTVGNKGEVRRWDADKMDVSQTYLLAAEPIVMAVRPDNDLVFVSTTDNKMHNVNLVGKKDRDTAITQPLHPNGARMTASVANVAYCSNGQKAIVRWESGRIGFWKPGDPKVEKLFIEEIATEKVAAPCMATTATGRYVVIGTKAGYVRLWDTNKNEKPKSDLAHRVEAKADCITDVVITEKGENFLTRGIDGKIIYWELATLKKLKEYTSPAGPGRLAVSPDGTTFTVLTPGRMELWKLP